MTRKAHLGFSFFMQILRLWRWGELLQTRKFLKDTFHFIGFAFMEAARSKALWLGIRVYAHSTAYPRGKGPFGVAKATALFPLRPHTHRPTLLKPIQSSLAFSYNTVIHSRTSPGSLSSKPYPRTQVAVYYLKLATNLKLRLYSSNADVGRECKT